MIFFVKVNNKPYSSKSMSVNNTVMVMVRAFNHHDVS